MLMMSVCTPSKQATMLISTTGVKTKDEDGDSEEEDEKMKERAEWAKDTKNRNKIYEGEVVFNKYVFKFIDDGNIVFQSEPDYFYSIKKDYKFYTEGAGGNDDEEEQDQPVVLTFDVIKFNTFVYTPYMLINKTDIPFYFGEKGSKFNNSTLVPPHANEFFNPQSSKKKKFSVAVENYDWADAFDITTLGMSGEASMKREKNFDRDNEIVNRYQSNNLQMGVLISTLSNPHGKTTSIKIVPRYVFMNHCNKPLVLSQDHNDTTKQYYIKPGDSITYNFENRGKKDNFVKLREPTGGDNEEDKFADYQEIPPTDWSSRFSIDDFEDFQISIKSNDISEDDEEIKEVNLQHADNTETIEEGNMSKVKWHEPSKVNGYRRFIRVIITTQDEATLFIMLCDPNMPEYRIHNYSMKKVSIYQKDVGATHNSKIM